MIELVHVWKYFSRKPVLKNVNLKIYPGEFLGIAGANGSGKTVLLHLLAGLLKPSKGEIVFNNDCNKNFGFVFQENLLEDFFTVEDALRYCLKLAGFNAFQIRKSVNHALKLVGLYNRKKWLVKHLSKGLKQCLELARVIALNPDVFILDEPFTGLDVKRKEKLKHFFKRLKHVKTLIIASLEIQDLSMCDKLVLLHNGKILITGDLKVLMSKLPDRVLELPINSTKVLNALKIKHFVTGDKVLCFSKNYKSLLAKMKSFEYVKIRKPCLQDLFLYHARER